MLSVVFATILCAQSFSYPASPVEPVAEKMHDVEIVDPYRWLEDSSDCRVQNWTSAQNQLTKSYLQSTGLQNNLRRRLNALDRYDYNYEEEVSQGNRRFVWIKKKDQEQTILGFKNSPTDAVKEIINPNTWGEGQKLDFVIPSPDGTYVAYGVSFQGDERPVIKIMDVLSGKILSDRLCGSKQGWTGGVSWLPNGEGFFFTAHPENGDTAYWNTVYYHQLGTQADQDIRVFGHDTVREYFHSAVVSDDGRYLLLARWKVGNHSELYLKKLDELDAPIITIVEGFGANYDAQFAGDKLLIVTDEEASNSHVFVAELDKPQRAFWKEIIPENADRLISVSPVGGRLYVNYLHNAHTVLKVFDVQGSWIKNISLKEFGTAEVFGYWHKDGVWVDYSSFIHPHARYRYDFVTNRMQLESMPSIPFDSSKYHVEQVWYPSKDGTEISLFVITAKKTATDKPRPTLLTGYGGFGVPITPAFGSSYIPFLEAGGSVVIANLRGGGEYGEEWHLAGCRERKQNVFDDFVAAAEWLIGHHYTDPNLLAIRGRSNGGLLMGAALTQRPDLFRAVLCEVPLLDMLRYHRFGFANCWCEEYGCSDDPEAFPYLLAYSPYHHIVEGVRYPAVLIRGAENDARTDPLHARKMAARLQAVDPCGLPKLLLVDKDSGHLGAVTLSVSIEQKVESLSFLMDQLGMTCSK